MKKIVVFLVLFLMVLAFGDQVKATTSVQDRLCVNTNETVYEPLGSNGINEQTFRPTKDRLTDVRIKIGGPGLNGSSPLRVTIIKKVGGTVIGSTVIQPTVNTPGIRTWTFPTPLTLDTTQVYIIRLEKVSGLAIPWWYYGDGDETCDGDNRTYGWIANVRQSWDFNYSTYGYNQPVETPVVDAPAATTPTTPSSQTIGTTAGTGTAPSATTSSAIKAAAGLKAEYANSAVNLAWTASTTADIDGYKVFRSEAATTGFAEIGKTVKATLTYADSKELVAEKTYYYMVRAYKGTAESASTSTVSMLIPIPTGETEAKVIPFSTDMTETTDWPQIQLHWVLGGVLGVLVVILVAHEKERARTQKLLSGRHFKLDK